MKSEYLTFIAVVVAFASFAAAHFRTKSASELSERIIKTASELSERVAKIETKVEVYFDLQEKYNAAILHRPTHKKVDELLEKRERLEPLPAQQDKQLDEELEKIINDNTQTIGLRAAAAQMLAARKARSECK